MSIFPLALAGASLVAAGVLLRRRRRWWAAAAAVAAIGFALYGSGVIHTPSVESMLTSLGSRLGNWTYLLVGVLAYLETSAFVGLVAPGEVAVVFGGFVAGQGTINPVVLAVIVWICAAGGDSTGYVLGRKLGRAWALRHGHRVGVTAQRFEVVERFFQNHGGKTILIGRFIGLFRALGPFVAGTARVPYGRFLAASVVGSGLWSAVFVSLGYVFYRSFHRALHIVQQGNIAFGALVLVLLAGFGSYRLWRRPETRARVRREVARVLGRKTVDDLEAARDRHP